MLLRSMLVLSGAMALGACGDTNEAVGPVEATEEAGSAAQGRGILFDPTHSAWREEAPDSFRARFETSKGTFIIEVHRAWAPIGADRFYNLLRHGFYDDQRFSRVVPGFIAQWGLSGDPEVTRAWRGQTIPDDPVVESNTKGTIAYAMTGPNTRLTQVYISLVDNSRLDEQGFAPFGRVVEGMEVVDSLYDGYGEEAGGGMRAGNQGPLEEGGTAYLLANYPELDYINRAFVE